MARFPYPGKFTFLDVEIPNQNSDRICAISLIVVEDGREVVRHTELINPQTFFSAANISVHHIRRKDVLNARTLDEFWKEYSRYFEDPYILAAHNTRSDVTVLNKDLSRLGKQIHSTRYIDTMDIMEQFYYKGNQQKGDLKLNSIAEHLEIKLDHHNPSSDVNCCYEVVRYMSNHFDMDLEPFIKPLTPPKHYHPHTQPKPTTKEMKAFLWKARSEIMRQSKSVRITEKAAKSKGDEAWKEDNYEAMVLNYEVAISKNCASPLVYLRLADFYDSMNMQYDALRVLDKGIAFLKRINHGWQELASARIDIRKGNNHPQTQSDKDRTKQEKVGEKQREGKKEKPVPAALKTSKSIKERILPQAKSKEKSKSGDKEQPVEKKKKPFFSKKQNRTKTS